MTSTAEAVAALTASIDNLVTETTSLHTAANATLAEAQSLTASTVTNAQAAASAILSGAQTAQQAAANSAASITTSATTAATKATEAAASATLAAQSAGAAGSGAATTLLYPALNKVVASASDIVDVMVYDTRLDSDGGEWTQKCSHTSWHNETLNTATRGARREFPKVAGLVLRNTNTSTLTIYDLTDLDTNGVPRMWMVFNAGSNALRNSGTIGTTNNFNSVFALNGRIYLGSGVTGGSGVGTLSCVNLLADTAEAYVSAGGYRWQNLALRNAGSYVASAYTYGMNGIIDRNVFGVHARVLPGAPLDAFGLPIPTVAVATYGGLSVIHPNGVVANITGFGGSNGIFNTRFINDNFIVTSTAGSPRFETLTFYVPFTNTTVAAAVGVTYHATYADPTTVPLPAVASGQRVNSIAVSDSLDIALPIGLAKVALDAQYQARSMVSYAAINYATGWQPGDIRGAYLCDGTTGDITGSAELITNGGFDTDLSGWTVTANGTSTAVQSGGAAVLTGDGTNSPTIAQSFATVSGQTYLLTVDIATTGGSHAISIGASAGSGNLASNTIAGADTSKWILQFVATTSTTWVSIARGGSLLPLTIDNVSCKLALPDRSYKGKGLVVNGTVTRNAANSGDVVAYSGFSTSNYLSQAYNSDLDFGTGDFSIAFWTSITGSGHWLDRVDPAGTGVRFRVYTSAGSIYAYAYDGSTLVQAVAAISLYNTGAHLINVVRRGSTIEIWLDGVKVASQSGTLNSLSSGTAQLYVGTSYSGSFITGSISMLRISAYAPTPAQIRKMYADEVQLFDSGAKAFIGGSSNSVADLDFDRSRKVLSVATGNGVSEFNGLRRTGYFDTTATGTLTSNTMKAVATGSGYRLLASGAEVVAYRETQNGIDVMNRYGPKQVGGPSVFKATTRDATPTPLTPRFFISEREMAYITVRLLGVQVGGAASERFSQTLNAYVYRDDGGQVMLGTPAAMQKSAAWNGGTPAEAVTETTTSLDAAIVVDTATNTVGVQVYGKASTLIDWNGEATKVAVGAQPYN